MCNGWLVSRERWGWRNDVALKKRRDKKQYKRKNIWLKKSAS